MTYPNNGNPQGYGNQPQNPFGQQPQQFNNNAPAPAPYQGGQPQYGQAYPVQQYPAGVEQKSWVAAMLLAFFFGYLGAHNFYLGKTNRGIGQLITFAVSCVTLVVFIGIFIGGALSIWAFVEFIMIIAGAGGYDRDGRGIPLRR